MSNDQREKILNAARKVFSTKGYSATMSDIAVAADISQGLAYRYFSGKESIMNELAERAIRSTMETIQSIKQIPGSPLQNLSFFISKIVENDDGLLEFFQIYQRNIQKPEEIRKVFLEQHKMMLETMKELIVEGQERGEIVKEDPEKLAYTLFVCLDGLSKFALLHPEKYKQLFPDACIIMRILKP